MYFIAFSQEKAYSGAQKFGTIDAFWSFSYLVYYWNGFMTFCRLKVISDNNDRQSSTPIDIRKIPKSVISIIMHCFQTVVSHYMSKLYTSLPA